MPKQQFLVTWTDPESGFTAVPLDVAAVNGHLEVVRELVLQQVGIEGCGGAKVQDRTEQEDEYAVIWQGLFTAPLVLAC